MAHAYLLPRISSCYVDLHCEDHKVLGLGNLVRPLFVFGSSRVPIELRFQRRDRISVRCRLGSTTKQGRTVDKARTPASALEIPVTCYQIIGLPDQSEKDEIVKSVMELKSAEIEEGYTMDTIMSRQDILMDVRDKLLFEPEYAGNFKEKIPPKSPIRIPWDWLPGTLSLLQEVGEEKFVLEIGRGALQHPEAKPHIHDLLLCMALAECATAKISFEKNTVSDGFEALARAQCLLRSKASLGKMRLLSQIEESLEELAPICTLELLAKPNTPENAERRRGAISALRELLRQGLDVETSCKVNDWPCFLNQALNRLLATEIVDLLPWVDIAMTRKNKKSLESQNQKVVIDFNCFYMALMAHMALGFSSRQTTLINSAKTVCDCLMASESIDLKFEEAFCSYLLGQGDEAEMVKRLEQFEINANAASRSLISRNKVKDGSVAKPSLEMWLKDALLGVFPDTRDCSPSLTNFFRGEKRSPGITQAKEAPKTTSGINHRPMSTKHASNHRDFEESLPYAKLSSPYLGSAVNQLAQANLQNSLTAEKNTSGSTVGVSSPSVQLNRKLGAHNGNVWERWLVPPGDLVRRIAFMAVVGCILFTTLKLLGLKVGNMKQNSIPASFKPNMETSLTASMEDSSLELDVGFARRLKKLLAMVNGKLGNLRYINSVKFQNGRLAASLSSSLVTAMSRRPMPVDEAESLVKQWQSIKAEALGPSHEVHSLSDVLDDSMLAQWQSLADAAISKSCFWRFVLLQLSVLRADILSDEMGSEIAEIDVLLEEAAELIEESQTKNPNYYSTYKMKYVLRRREDGSWRFCEGVIQTP